MSLYLVQHGKSLSGELDPQKGLSKEGAAEVERIAKTARGDAVRVSQIMHSGKKRARQTAEILADTLKPPKGIKESAGLNPLDDASALAGTIDTKDNIMFVGHLPFMERLTSYLITGTIETPVFKFQNGGILCMDKDQTTGSWVIKWALMPMIG